MRETGHRGRAEEGEGSGTKDAIERPRRRENIDAAFTRRIFLDNPASVGRERASERVDGPARVTHGDGIVVEMEGGKGGARYRQLAGSYIELRSGAYLSANPSNLSPWLSPAFSSVHPPPSFFPLSPAYFTSSDNAFSEYTDNSH